MIRWIMDFLEQRSKRRIMISAVLLLFVLGGLDHQSDKEIRYLLLYLIPVACASWFVSRAAGLSLSIAAFLTWFISNGLWSRSYSAPWIAPWNSVMCTGVFVVFTLTLSELRGKFDALSDFARQDFMTGVPNTRAFYELAAQEMQRAFSLEPMTLAFIDVVGFRWLNQHFGYPAGDQAICTIVHTIRQHVPRQDLVARIGGTSFAILLPNSASDAARFILENIEDAFTAQRRKHCWPLTFCISAITCANAPRKVAELVQQAESQMTRIKDGGTDVLQIAEIEDMPPLQ